MYPHKIHPLLLPEILSYVSQHVEPEDLINCSFVCRTWNTAFDHLVWKTCVINSQYGPPRIPFQAVEARIKHINKLVYMCRFDLLDNFSFICPHLETLEVHDKSWSSMIANPLWLNVADVIADSPTLTTIRLSANHNALAIDIWDAIMDSPRMKNLHLTCVNITDVEQANAFFNVCTMIGRLELEMCAVLDPWKSGDLESMTVPAFFPLLQEIKFVKPRDSEPEIQLHLVTRCPALRSVYWRGPGFSLILFSMAEVPQFDLPNLESLDVIGRSLTRQEIEHFLKNNNKPLKKLAIPGSFFDQTMFKSLTRHFQTLQELDISLCGDVKSSGVAFLLRSCPLLTSFKAGTLLAPDVEPDEIWGCAGRLITLSLTIAVREKDYISDSKLMFRCLSRLSSLQELNISGYEEKSKNYFRPLSKGVDFSTSPLQIRLDCGLAQLSTLRQLKRFYFCEKGGQCMTMQEANWIKEYWRMLQIIHGQFNSDSYMNSKIYQLFGANNKRYLRRQPIE